MFGNKLERAFYRRLGRRIRMTREQRDMLPSALAARLHSPAKPGYICDIESGNVSVSALDACRLAAILNVPFCYLIGDDDLSNWCSNERFINAYFRLSLKHRQEIAKLVQHLAGDRPIIDS